MKTTLKIKVCCLLSVVSIQIWGFDGTFKFTLNDFTLEKQENQDLFIRPTASNYSYECCKPGDPLLPYYICRFPSCNACSETTLYYEIVEKKLVASEIEIKRSPCDVRIGYDMLQLPVHESEGQIFPDSLVWLFNGPMYGDKNITLCISPFYYDSTERNLYFASKIHISFEEQSIFRSVDRTSTISSADDDFDYLIITADSLVDTFEKLRNWKITKGLRTKIVSLESIHGNHYGQISPLEIKSYIMSCHTNNNVSMVLLGGYDGIVPSQRTRVYKSAIEPVNVPTDMFYGCFDNNIQWNANNNTVIGEQASDGIDYVQDIDVTRLPVRTREQLDAYIDKLICYEKNPCLDDDSLRILLSGSLLWWSDAVNGKSDAQIDSENLLHSIDTNIVANRFFVDTRNDFGLSGAQAVINANNVSNIINSYRPHWLSMDCHGDNNRWCFDLDDPTKDFSSYHALNLHNDGFPMVVTTAACFTANFSAYNPCLAESFLFHPTGGAIAYFGSTFEGICTQSISSDYGPAMTLCADFWNQLSENNHYGNAARMAKNASAYWADHGSIQYDWQIKGLNPLGDCEMPIYTEVPKEFSGMMITVNFENILLEYDCVFEDWKTACVSKNDHGESFFLADEGMDCVYVNNTTPHTFCLTKKNYVPLVVESGRYVGNALNNDLYLQNITYESNTVVYNSENNVYIGNHVDSSSDYGDVTIESGATLNIDFENRVVIQSGIKCKAGGKFRLNYQYL